MLIVSAILLLVCLVLTPLELYQTVLVGNPGELAAFALGLALLASVLISPIPLDGTAYQKKAIKLCGAILALYGVEIAHLMLLDSVAAREEGINVGSQSALRLAGIACLVAGAICPPRRVIIRLGALLLIATSFALGATILLDVLGLADFSGARRSANRIDLTGLADISSTGIMSTKGLIAILFSLSVVSLHVLSEQFRLSRSAAFAVGLAVLFLAMMSGSRNVTFTVILVGIVIIASASSRAWIIGIVTIVLLGPLVMITFWADISYIVETILLQGGNEPRIALFFAALAEMRESWVLGVGPHHRLFEFYVGDTVVKNAVHTVWLQVPLFGGLVGWLVVLLLASLFYSAFRGRAETKSIVLPAFLAVLVPSSFFPPFQSAFVSWCAALGWVVFLARYMEAHVLMRGNRWCAENYVSGVRSLT